MMPSNPSTNWHEVHKPNSPNAWMSIWKNIVEEKRITTGIHQVFGQIFDRIGFNKIPRYPSRKRHRLKGIISNTKKLTAAEQITHYAGLWQVEETFRISKHDLRFRSIFHRTDRWIKAHLAICFMALSIMRIAEYEIALRYKLFDIKHVSTPYEII